MLTPLPHQLSGALFLSGRRTALLADAPRVGKTGTALIAADYIQARSVLIVTTASGRAVWRRAVKDWCQLPHDFTILGWPELATAKGREAALRPFDLVILDESHNAKNFDAKRTQAVYGLPDGGLLRIEASIAAKASTVWALTGTPMPNSALDLYPMMRALCPDRLTAWGFPTDVSDFEAFADRYTFRRPKTVGWHRTIMVVRGPQTERERAQAEERNAELRARLDGFVLRRTQRDVGIRPPIYELMPIEHQGRKPDNGDAAAILAAAEAGNTRDLEMHLGPLRRITGTLKVPGVVRAVEDAFDGGLDKVVLAYWHRDVGDALCTGLGEYGVVRLDGSTSEKERATAEARFRDPKNRVFVGQIQAAGEAIDLSASAELWFVESSFVPAQMAQAAMRITNHGQIRQAVVRVCVLEGSIDETLQAILMRKWVQIKEVLINA